MAGIVRRIRRFELDEVKDCRAVRSERRSDGIEGVPGGADIVLQWRWNVRHRALR